MHSHKFTRRLLLITISMLIFTTLSGHAQNDPFYGCGIISGDSSCYVFDIDGLHNTYYLLDSIDGINSGEWACVYGIHDIYCDTSCASVIGCVAVDSIFPQEPPDTTFYEACGVLLQGADCVIFTPISGPIYDSTLYIYLDYYGPFVPGDTVCVSGVIMSVTPPDCPEANARLLGNSIEAWSPSNYPYSGCGILVFDLGCLLFMPLDLPTTYYYLENYGTFIEGDTVCISGILVYECDTACAGSDGCIIGNTIYAWEDDGDWPYEDCGVIVQGVDCVVFAPFGDTVYLALDYTGEFTVGDSVCISGVVDWGCDFGCSGVAGCIYTSSITYRIDFYHNFEAIIKMEDGFSIEPILTQFQGYQLDSIIDDNLYLVGFAPSYMIEDITRTISLQPGVIFVQPNYTVGMPEAFHVSQDFPDDAQPTLVWGVSPISYFSNSACYNIQSDSANLYSSGENTVVAVIDNGVALDHPLLVNSISAMGYDFVENDNDPSEEPGSLSSHGTFVCGIIRRIAPDCMILPIRAFDTSGFSNSFMLANAIKYAINQSADVINMSFGTYTSNPVIQEAVYEAVQSGISMVAAVGNAGTNIPSYPAAYPGVIAVSALDTLEYRADFSNYGDHLDVCAPGVNVYSSLAGNFEWGWWSGTSFAAPYASAVCALIMAQDNELTPFEVESLIKQTADNNLNWGSFIPPSTEYGYGRVDALHPVFDVSLGDVNDTGSKDIMDIIYLINTLYANGPQPIPVADVGDTDCSDVINLFDIVRLIKFLYLGGPRPSCFNE